MDLDLEEDQRSVEELFESFFDNECPSERVRAAEPLGFDADLWRRLAETGACAMGLPESMGGSNASVLDAALVAERIGRNIAPLPFIEHFVATRLLVRCDAADATLSEPDTIATLALHPLIGDQASLVPAGAVATHVVAVDAGALILGRDDPPRRALANFASSPLADRRLDPASRDLLRAAPKGADGHAEALDEWRALTASALVGVAQGSFDLGLAYARERTQFDVAIGSFQALQHGFADLAVALDGARLLARKAAWAFDAEPTESRRLAAKALVFCGDVAMSTAAFALHVHGGYGVSEEYDIQLYFRRAKGWRLILDDPAVEIARLGDMLYPRSEAPAARGGGR